MVQKRCTDDIKSYRQTVIGGKKTAIARGSYSSSGCRYVRKQGLRCTLTAYNGPRAVVAVAGYSEDSAKVVATVVASPAIAVVVTAVTLVPLQCNLRQNPSSSCKIYIIYPTIVRL